MAVRSVFCEHRLPDLEEMIVRKTLVLVSPVDTAFYGFARRRGRLIACGVQRTWW